MASLPKLVKSSQAAAEHAEAALSDLFISGRSAIFEQIRI
jgi:hypothetical protein